MSVLKIKNGNTWIEIPAGGVGVPSGGTSGQLLKKSNSTDYSTEWYTLTSSDLLAQGMTVLSSYQYGTTLPTAGNEGRIFFLKVE